MRHIIILWHILLIPLLGYSQICGITDTTIISSGATETIPIVIAPGDLFNDNLADPNQGLCGIEITFTHQYTTDLGLSLESPSGQIIQLTGPTNISTVAPPTFFSVWRIRFVPSSEIAAPDPNFTPRWDNNLNVDNLINFGRYQGSYYPFNGDLEDFNTGTVSGTWNLIADNAQSLNAGAILSVRLIFCDQAGLDCCFADAGRLDDPDVKVCIGDSSLDFVPDNRYLFRQPDPDFYGFTYLVSRDSVLLFYDSTGVDLTNLPAGRYQVCGLSYLRSDSLLLPEPNGVYSLVDMFSDLNSNAPTFCGDLTGDCQRIVIEEPTPPVDFPVEICEGASYTFVDSTYTEVGTYPYILKTDAGCDSVVNIILSLVPTQTVRVDSTICNGETVEIGTSMYNTAGVYRDTLVSAIGCDSVVVLDLVVVEDIITNLDTIICQGDSLVINGQAYFQTDQFQLVLPSSRICDSIVNVDLHVLNPIINLAAVDTITCAQPTVLLDASASTPSGTVTFEWRNLAGLSLGTEPTLLVDEPGDYVLLLTEELAGRNCIVLDTIRVVGDLTPPIADAGADQLLTCLQTVITLGGTNTSTGNEFSYSWIADTGNFLDAPTIPGPRIDAAGTYTLEVTNNRNSCRDTSVVTINAIQDLPVVRTLPDTVITCINPNILLTSDGSSQGVDLIYEWRNSLGAVLSNDPSLLVNAGDTYRLIIRNSLSACADSTSVTVAIDTISPEFNIAPPVLINCERSSVQLNVSTVPLDPDVVLTWTTTNGGVIGSAGNTLNPIVTAAGTYTLELSNTRNGCEITSSVEVADVRNTQSAQPRQPDIISCGLPSVTLDIGTSSSGPDVIYQWDTQDGQFVGTATGATVEVNAPGTYTLTVLDTLSRCSDMASIEVQRDINIPTAEAGPGFTIDCEVSQDTLWGSGSTSGAGIVYEWSGPCLESSPDSLWVIASCSGMYYLQVTDLTNSCSIIDSVEVLLDQDAPVAVVVTADTLTCARTEVVLDGSISSPSNDLQFNWSGPGISGSIPDPRISVDLPGNYQLIVNDATNGCADTLIAEVAINNVGPIVDAGADLILTCDSPTGTIGSMNTSSGLDYTYNWVEIEGQLPGASDSPVTNVDQEGIFRLIVTDVRTGCRDSSQVVVIENKEIPGANAGPDLVLNCSQDLVELDGSNSVKGPDIVYEWSGPCLVGRTDSIGVRADCAGTYFIKVTNTRTGCAGIDSVIITLNPDAPSAILPDTSFIDCATGTALLDGSVSSAGFYRWTRGGTIISSGSNQISVDETGLYVLMVENLDNSCFSLDSIMVVENCQPEAIILPPASINCLNATVTIDASNSQGASLVYEWIAPDPNCIVTGQGTPQLEVNCGGDYTLILTNDQLMLSDTQMIRVVMDDNQPMAIVGPPDTLNCVKNEVILDGSASSTGPNIIYTWTRVSNSALLAETATASTQEPGTYVLEVLDTVTLCSATATIRIVEFNLPISLSFGDSVRSCGQDTFALSTIPTPQSDFYIYNWEGPEVLDHADSVTALVGNLGTYTVTVTDQRSECEAVASVNLTEEQQCPPCVTIVTPDTLTCSRSMIELEASFCRTCTGCVIQWTTSDGNITANANTLRPTVDQMGTYRIEVIDLQGFQTAVEVEVMANNAISVADAGPDRSLTCDSTTLNLGVRGLLPAPDVIYAWSRADAPGAIAGDQPGLVVDLPGSYVLALRDTVTGCISLDTVLVTLDTLSPVANAGPDQILTCEDPFVILNGGGSSSGNGFQFTWTNSGAANCLQGADAANPIVSCPGIYYLEIKNTNTGCYAIDSVQVTTANDLPVLTPFPDTVLTCDQDSVALTADLVDTGDLTVQWCTLDPNGQTIGSSCIEALSIMVGDPGNYRFTAINNSTGCEAAFAVSVTDARVLPLIDAGPDLSFGCSDDSIKINAQAGPDISVLDLQWISTAGLPINDDNPLNPTIFAADTLFMLAVDQQTGCTTQDTVVIFPDLSAPVADAGMDTALTCLQTTLQLQGSGFAETGNSISYQWTTPDGNIQTNANTAMPLINRPGTYILTIADLQNGCTATDVVIVDDRQIPPIAAVADLDRLQFSCDVDTLLLDGSGSMAANNGALDYLWTVVSTGSLIGAPDQPSIRTDAIGTYRLVVTDRNSGCRDSIQFTLSAAIGAPVIRIADPISFTCNRSEVIIDATASEFGSDYAASWFDAQGNVVQNNGLTLRVNEPGPFRLQIENLQTGCSNLSDPVTVSIDTLPPAVNIAPTDLLDCTINSVVLDGSASSGGPEFTYQWTTAGGIFLNSVNQPTTLAGGPGTYILEVNNTRNGCITVDSVLVEAITTPISGLALDMTAPGCTNDAGGSIIVSEVIGGMAPFVFQLNDGAEVNIGTFTQLRAGNYTLSVRDINGCEWTEEIVILEASPIEVDLGLDLTIFSGDSIEIMAQASSPDIVTYQWDPALGNGPSLMVAPQISTSYGITVTDNNGCSATDRVQITVEKTRPYFIPNAFSPNGDGSNDRFMVMAGPEVINIPTFRIYDRWGHLVFERNDIPPNDPGLGWDGRHNGNLMNAAVFVYYVELEYSDGWVESVQGDIALLR